MNPKSKPWSVPEPIKGFGLVLLSFGLVAAGMGIVLAAL
jgi:hypothetical protein